MSFVDKALGAQRRSKSGSKLHAMPRVPKLRPAAPDEFELLSELAIRSKAYWGYSATFMAACRGELEVTRAELECSANDHVVAEVDHRVVGFYTLEPGASEVFELDALFVEPGYLGRGLGRALLEHALANAVGRGAKRMIIQSDPHAEAFYRAMGAVQVGSRASDSIAGRVLSVFAIELDLPDFR